MFTRVFKTLALCTIFMLVSINHAGACGAESEENDITKTQLERETHLVIKEDTDLQSVGKGNTSEIISHLKAIFGSSIEVKCDFKKDEGILRSLNINQINRDIKGEVAARALGDSLFTILEPYIKIKLSEVGYERNINSDDGFTLKYYQKSYNGISFEYQPETYLQINKSNKVQLINRFIYDIQLPPPPYISREFLDSLIIHEGIDGLPIFPNIPGPDTNPNYIDTSALAKAKITWGPPQVDMVITDVQYRESGTEYGMLVFKVVGCNKTLKINAVTGDILSIYNTGSQLICKTKGDFFAYGSHNASSQTVGLHTVLCTDKVAHFGYYTDWNGNSSFPDSTSYQNLLSYLRCDSLCTMYDEDTGLIISSDSLYNLPPIPPYIDYAQVRYSDPYYASSMWQYIQECRKWIVDRLQFYPMPKHIIVNCRTSQYLGDLDNLGNAYLDYIALRYDVGKYASVAKHEFCHSSIINLLNNHFVYEPNDSLFRATDEALANFYACMSEGKNDSSIIYMPGKKKNLADSTKVQNILNFKPSHLNTMNESDWSRYSVNYCLASVWWKLRGDSLSFKIWEEIWKILRDDNIFRSDLSNRYKPRTLFNRLMHKLNNTPTKYILNENQKKVINAYNSRGFYFYPTIATCDKNGNRQEAFTYHSGPDYLQKDKLYLKIEQCPPNTPIKIYIVQRPFYWDGTQTSITYCDSMDIGNLHDNIVMELEKQTDSTGVWTNCLGSVNPGDSGIGLEFNDVPLGNIKYDVIVDVLLDSNDPTSAVNNGKLRYNFTGIQDAIKGLDPNTPGFFIRAEKISFLVFDIDHSGSMLQKLNFGFFKEKFRLAERAAIYCLNSLYLGSKTGLVFFNEEAHAMDLGGSPVRRLERWPYDYKFVREVIEHQGSYGGTGTNIPNAIETAYRDVFINYNNIDSVSTLLIVDGEHAMTVEELVGQGYPDYPPNAKLYILTIGEPSYLFYRGLELLASHWKGKVYTSHNEYSLMESILEFLSDYNRFNIISTDKGLILPQDYESRVVQFSVDSAVHGVSVQLLLSDIIDDFNIMPLELVDPNGIHYLLDDSNEDVIFKHDGCFNYVDITNPIAGNWTVSFSKDGNYQDSLYYVINISAQKEYDFSVTLSPSMPTITTGISYVVKINSPCYDVSEGSVEIDIVDPDGIITTKQLFDDGLHNDGEACDGIFGVTYLKNDKIGKYNSIIRVTYPDDTTPYFRNCSFYNYEDSLSYRPFHHEWNWVGFPRIPGDSLALVNAQDFFYPSLPNINQVLSQNGEMEFDGYNCNHDTIGMINGYEGYKLLIPEDFDFLETGTQIDTTRAIEIYQDNWYWLCYPKKTRLEPEEIFADALQCFDYIMAEEWSMKKENGVWEKGENSSKPMLEYGDAFEAHAMQDAVLYWSPLSVSKPEVLRLDPQYYTYDMKPEYETVMIDSIYGSPEFEEIGVFYNNDCIGAQVFEGYPIQLLVYTPDQQKNNEPYEFRLFDGNKSNLTFNNVFDLSDNQENSHYLYPSPRDFRVVHLLKSDNIPPVVTMAQNFPNPFNPTTTIRFSLPATKQVKLRIYNVKGQLVKELLNEPLDRGFHTVVWNGKNQQNRNAASGLYFYRLDSEDKVIVKKAMMLK